MQKKAILIFARDLSIDLVQRKWPKAFGRLLDLRFLRTNQEVPGDLHLFTTGCSVTWQDIDCEIHQQRRASFGERLQEAAGELSARGYNQIVIIGRDCPDLSIADLEEAFRNLQDYRLVLGPDHRGGLYLIGLHSRDTGILRQIRWQENTDFDQLSSRVSESELRILAEKHDLDCTHDLRTLSRSRVRLSQLASNLLTRLQIVITRAEELSVQDQLAFVRKTCQKPPPNGALNTA